MDDAAPPRETNAPALDGAAARGNALLAGVVDWIMDAAIADTPIEELLGGDCLRLFAAGAPLARVHISYRTLHPAIESVSLVWTPERGVEAMAHTHGAGTSDTWRRSPFYFMIENDVQTLRRRLTGPAASLDFPVLDDLAGEGFTDYLAFMIGFDDGPPDLSGRGNGIVTSWVTRREGGFVDDDIAAMLRVKRQLAVAAKMAIKKQIAENVVDTYLGPRAGRAVLRGQIQRGDGDSIHAVVWYSDLRGSSPLADSLPARRFIALLNGYFECAAGAVIEAGGEVLNYIGDGVFAIFPIDGDRDTCAAAAAALSAAREARKRLAGVNETLEAAGADPLQFGVALHVGHVVFGNIGAGARLAFTTIGAAVNEVARMDEMTKTLGVGVLASGEFRALLPEEEASRLDGLGFHKLRGIGAPIDLYGVPD